MLKPVGFWSYTKADDTNSRGRITQLRALLEAELQQRVGRATEKLIFQDLEGIGLGSVWEQQIRTAVDAATFFIPIVTPAFLHSEWCCRETMLFRQREQALNRADLIFPIHFVSVDHIDAENPSADECYDPAVLPFLRTRQWLDYRPLRQFNPDSTETAMLLEKLAGAIFTAMRAGSARARPAPPPAPPPTPPPQLAPPEPVPSPPASTPPASTLDSKKSAPSSIALAIVIGLASAAGVGGMWYYLHPAAPAPEATTPPPAPAPQPTASPPAAGTRTPSAADDYNAGRYEAAFAKYKYAADHDDSNAQYQVGFMYQEGKGVAVSQAAALEWYKKSAAADNPLAQARLGYFYQKGIGVTKSYADAAHWYALAAEHGQKDAQSNLGALFLSGNGVTRDPKTAEYWFLKAAAQHAIGAEQQLAIMYEKGLVRQADPAAARRWSNEAAADMYRMGLQAATGDGVPRNLVTARDWMTKAAKAGNADAQGWLAKQ